MQGFDYVGKRVLFAAVTVFVAITELRPLPHPLGRRSLRAALPPVHPDVQGVPARSS